MARIDVKTLVLAFEKKIGELEKNPPDKVPMSVIISILERNIEEVIKEHFLELIKVQINKSIENEFQDMHREFIRRSVENILSDLEFQTSIEKRIKYSMLKDLEI